MQKLKPIGIYLLCLLYPLIVMAGNYTFFDIVDPNRAYVAGNRATMMDDYSVTRDYEMCTNAVGATTDCTPKVVSDTNAGDANLVLVDNVASFDLHRGGTVLWVSAKVPPIGADGNATLDADGNTVVDASGNTVIVTNKQSFTYPETLRLDIECRYVIDDVVRYDLSEFIDGPNDPLSNASYDPLSNASYLSTYFSKKKTCTSFSADSCSYTYMTSGVDFTNRIFVKVMCKSNMDSDSNGIRPSAISAKVSSISVTAAYCDDVNTGLCYEGAKVIQGRVTPTDIRGVLADSIPDVDPNSRLVTLDTNEVEVVKFVYKNIDAEVGTEIPQASITFTAPNDDPTAIGENFENADASYSGTSAVASAPPEYAPTCTITSSGRFLPAPKNYWVIESNADDEQTNSNLFSFTVTVEGVPLEQQYPSNVAWTTASVTDPNQPYSATFTPSIVGSTSTIGASITPMGSTESISCNSIDVQLEPVKNSVNLIKNVDCDYFVGLRNYYTGNGANVAGSHWAISPSGDGSNYPTNMVPMAGIANAGRFSPRIWWNRSRKGKTVFREGGVLVRSSWWYIRAFREMLVIAYKQVSSGGPRFYPVFYGVVNPLNFTITQMNPFGEEVDLEDDDLLVFRIYAKATPSSNTTTWSYSNYIALKNALYPIKDPEQTLPTDERFRFYWGVDYFVPFMYGSCEDVTPTAIPIIPGKAAPASILNVPICYQSRTFKYSQYAKGLVRLDVMYIAPDNRSSRYPTNLMRANALPRSCPANATGALKKCWRIASYMPPTINNPHQSDTSDENLDKKCHKTVTKQVQANYTYNCGSSSRPRTCTATEPITVKTEVYDPACNILEPNPQNECNANMAFRFSGYFS